MQSVSVAYFSSSPPQVFLTKIENEVIWYFFFSLSQFTSSIFLTVLSADRYIAVCHPISAPKYRTPVIARCVSLTAWAASALLMVPVFMYAATLTRPDGGQTCNIFWPDGKENSGNEDDEGDDQDYLFSNATDIYETEGSRNFSPRAFTIYSLVLGFAIPLSLILIFYAQVVFKLRTVGELRVFV